MSSIVTVIGEDISFLDRVEVLHITETRPIYQRENGSLVSGEMTTTLRWTSPAEEDVTGLVPLSRAWEFIEGCPNQSSSDDDWYALTVGGYTQPEQVLADPVQIAKVMEARETLESFFAALREAGLREEG